MNEFTERYKTYENTELLRVLENSENYQPSAIEAVKEELAARQLSDNELNMARAELEAEKQEIDGKKRKQEEIQNKIKEKGGAVLDTINPVMETEKSPPKLINAIAAIFGLISILQIITQFSLITSLFSDFSEWDISVFTYLFPIVMAPLATILFWRKKMAGWVLFAIYLAYVFTGLIFLFIALSNAGYIFASLFFGGTLWLICQERIKSVYHITEEIVYLTIIPVIVVTSLCLALYFYF